MIPGYAEVERDRLDNVDEEVVPFVDLRAQYRSIEGEIDGAIKGVLERGAFILGPNVEEFEREFAKFLGARHVIGCANGSDALEMVYRAWGIKPGDEVIVPANTWITTVSAATMYGARPVFVDTCEDFTIDVTAIERHITPRTKVIAAVHLYGMPANMGPIMDIAKRYNLRVLEDCAQAHGTLFSGRHVGTIGHAGTFSFYPSKNLGAYGDAGAIAVNDDETADLLRRLGNHGQKVKHDHRIEGRNSRLDEIQAAILRVKLRYLPSWVQARTAHSREYIERLSGLPLSLPSDPSWGTSSWHIFAVRHRDRDSLRIALAQNGIESNVHYPMALPLVPAYSHLGLTHRDVPVAYEQTNTVVALPMFAELSRRQIDKVASVVRKFIQS